MAVLIPETPKDCPHGERIVFERLARDLDDDWVVLHSLGLVKHQKKLWGEADFILSFELLEAARWVEYLKKDGVLLTNTQRINPMPVITGTADYPKTLEAKLSALPIRLDAMDALGLALRAGSSKAVNLVLLGRLSRYFHFTDEQWQDAIEKSVPEKFLELNKKAFALGAEA